MKTKMSDIEQSFLEEFLRMEKGFSYTDNLFGLVKVEYRIRWEDDDCGAIVVDKIVPCKSLLSLFKSPTFLSDLQLDIENHLYETKPFNRSVVEFNKTIKRFIKRVGEFGNNNFGDNEYFFRKYVWPSSN